jgi:two-component system sensor histidine kinase ArlS
MNKPLLYKTRRAYLIVSLVIVVISAPLFYVVTEKLYTDEADETLLLQKKEFLKYNQPRFRVADIPTWNAINRNIKIDPAMSLTGDSVFQKIYLDTLVHEEEPYRVLVTPVQLEHQRFTLRIRLNLVEAEDMIESIGLLFFLILILLLAGWYFATLFLSRRLWKSFYNTLSQLEQFDLDKSGAPHWQFTDVAEFQRLNDSVGKLLERNIRVFRSQREFTENASHELQTPLAVFQAKLDTLAQQLSLTTDVSHTLSALTEAASRLSRINKNLLLLSKLDNNQYTETIAIQVGDVLTRLTGFFREQAKEKNVAVSLTITASRPVTASLTLLEMAVSNLLLNAVRHNRVNGEIRVAFGEQSLTIANTGTTGALVAEKLFQRFSPQGPEKEGSGLGLAIVKKIAELNGWKVTYSFDNGWHTFQLRF